MCDFSRYHVFRCCCCHWCCRFSVYVVSIVGIKSTKILQVETALCLGNGAARCIQFVPHACKNSRCRFHASCIHIHIFCLRSNRANGTRIGATSPRQHACQSASTISYPRPRLADDVSDTLLAFCRISHTVTFGACAVDAHTNPICVSHISSHRHRLGAWRCCGYARYANTRARINESLHLLISTGIGGRPDQPTTETAARRAHR